MKLPGMATMRRGKVLAFRRPGPRPAPAASSPATFNPATFNEVAPRPAVMRRHPLVRLLKPFLLALVLVAAPLLVVGFFYHSPLFALTELRVEIDGERLDEYQVHHELRPLLGYNLPRLPMAWVDDHLTRHHPWVRSVDLRKELPGRLHVRVIEKRAVALWRRGSELVYLDEDGATVTRFDPSAVGPRWADGDLLLVSSESPGLELAGAIALRREIEAVGPAWGSELSEIEMLGEKDFRLWSAGLDFPLLVRSGTLAHKNVYLEKILPQIETRYGRLDAVDLRFARRIIVQPSGKGMGG